MHTDHLQSANQVPGTLRLYKVSWHRVFVNLSFDPDASFDPLSHSDRTFYTHKINYSFVRSTRQHRSYLWKFVFHRTTSDYLIAVWSVLEQLESIRSWDLLIAIAVIHIFCFCFLTIMTSPRIDAVFANSKQSKGCQEVWVLLSMERDLWIFLFSVPHYASSLPHATVGVRYCF